MNRADLSWALSAVLPHAGRDPRPSFVGIEHCGEWLYFYATDRYTLAIARIPYTDVPVQNGYAHLLLSTKEATELERFVRPVRVADKEANVAYSATVDELHIGLDDESGVFDATPDTGQFDSLLTRVKTVRETAVEWQPVTIDPAFLARFAKAKRDDTPVRIEPKHGGKAGALLVTAGSDFIGVAMEIAYDHPTSVPDFSSWPTIERKAAA